MKKNRGIPTPSSLVFFSLQLWINWGEVKFCPTVLFTLTPLLFNFIYDLTPTLFLLSCKQTGPKDKVCGFQNQKSLQKYLFEDLNQELKLICKPFACWFCLRESKAQSFVKHLGLLILGRNQL